MYLQFHPLRKVRSDRRLLLGILILTTRPPRRTCLTPTGFFYLANFLSWLILDGMQGRSMLTRLTADRALWCDFILSAFDGEEPLLGSLATHGFREGVHSELTAQKDFAGHVTAFFDIVPDAHNPDNHQLFSIDLIDEVGGSTVTLH